MGPSVHRIEDGCSFTWAERSAFYGREFYGAETDSHSTTTTPGRTDGRNNNASEGDTANIATKKVGDFQWDDFNEIVLGNVTRKQKAML